MKVPSTLTYKGYSATIVPDESAGIFHGEVSGITDVVTFQSSSLESLQQEFEVSIDDYLEFCRSRGEKPNDAQL